jgi:hypothetical protein
LTFLVNEVNEVKLASRECRFATFEEANVLGVLEHASPVARRDRLLVAFCRNSHPSAMGGRAMRVCPSGVRGQPIAAEGHTFSDYRAAGTGGFKCLSAFIGIGGPQRSPSGGRGPCAGFSALFIRGGAVRRGGKDFRNTFLGHKSGCRGCEAIWFAIKDTD